MAVKITKQIKDSSGDIRTEIYANIGKNYRYNKTGSLITSPEYYRSEASYIAKESPISVNNGIGAFNVTLTDASTQLLFDFLYTPFISELVKYYGLVNGEIWSDKTGVWVQVVI